MCPEKGAVEVRSKVLLSGGGGGGKGREKNLSSLLEGWDSSEENKCCDVSCSFWKWILRGPKVGRLFQVMQSKRSR